MYFYKNKNDDFLIQLNDRQLTDQDIELIEEQKHEGDEEKHKPIIHCKNQEVTIKMGDIMHPMTPEHHISLIALKTKRGGQYRLLSSLETPIVTFYLEEDDQALEVYGYCNIHGLWKEVC